MRTPWKRHREGENFDAWVRTRRPEATDAFLEQLVARAHAGARGHSRQPLRLVFAVSFAILVAVALASVGGLSYAASTVGQSAQHVQAILSPQPAAVVSSPGDDQYKPGRGCGDKNHLHERNFQCKVTINNVSSKEGNPPGTTPFVFTVALSGLAIDTVTVQYNTQPGSATTPSDYSSTSGTLTFLQGQSSKTVTVQVVRDTVKEANETFFVKLTNPSPNALIADDTGDGTIQNDDK